MRMADEILILGTVRDITSRKLAEERLKAEAEVTAGPESEEAEQIVHPQEAEKGPEVVFVSKKEELEENANMMEE